MTEERSHKLYQMLLELAADVRRSGIVEDENGELDAPDMDPVLAKKLEDFVRDMAPKMLYRYRCGSELDLQALEDDRIWLSSLKEFNDPFEARVSVDRDALAQRLLLKEGIRDIGKDHSLYREVMKELDAEAKRLRDWLDSKTANPHVACFSEDHASILMWAHYADSHRGICIGYDYEDLFREYGVNLLPVTYSDHYERTDTFDPVENYEHHLRSYMTKASQWSYEREWRLMGKVNRSGVYEKGSLTGSPVPRRILMGVAIDSGKRKKLEDLCRRKGIELFQMGLSDKRYGLLSYPVKL